MNKFETITYGIAALFGESDTHPTEIIKFVLHHTKLQHKSRLNPYFGPKLETKRENHRKTDHIRQGMTQP